MTFLAPVSALLISALAFGGISPLPAAGTAANPLPTGKDKPAVTRTADAPAPLTPRERAEHAVSRLTFGAQPGQIAEVERIGVDRWIDQQLHPEKLPDTHLQTLLAELPAMQLSEADLLRRFPPTQVIRNMQRSGDLALPSDPVERAIYANQLENYRQKQDSKAARNAGQPASAADRPAAAAATGATAMADAAATLDTSMLPATGAATAAKPGVSDPDLTDAERQQVRADKDRLLALTDPNARFNMLLQLAPGEPRRVLQRLRPAERQALAEGMTPAQKEDIAALASTERLVTGEAMAQKLLYDTYSDRQLLEVMTDFWLNHFNVYDRKNDRAPWQIAIYERDTLRPHALGRFEDLLRAVATSPAMMEYLDNAQSIGPDSQAAVGARKRAAQPSANGKPAGKAADRGLNENYARELMELHTLGVDGGYTQHDVTEVAKVFTGWTVDPPRQGGGFHYEPRRHQPGSKTVLGKTIHEDGQEEGFAVLHMLATSPATAHFLSRKLAVHFVSDNPPAALVDRMAAAYLQSGGDIRVTLRAMLTAPEFWSRDAFRAKVKTPLEFVVSSLRATAADAEKPASAIQALTTLGMPIYGMQTPNGYSYRNDAWVSSSALIGRMNFALALTSGKLPQLTCDPAMLSAEPAGAPSAVIEQHLEQVLLDNDASARTRSTVLKEMADLPAQETAARQAAQQIIAGGQGSAMQNYPRSTPPAQMDGPAAPLAANYRKAPARDRAGADQTNAPEGAVTEASVAAGLLLGSPEFQRR